MKKEIEKPDNGQPEKSVKRREVIKGLATLPIAGAVAYGAYKKRQYDQLIGKNISGQVGISYDAPPAIPPSNTGNKVIRIGLIGFGIRGKQLAKALGFAHPTQVDEWKKAAAENKNDTRYAEFLEQENLGIKVTAICDIFRSYEQMAVEAGANINRIGLTGNPKRCLKFTKPIRICVPTLK